MKAWGMLKSQDRIIEQVVVEREDFAAALHAICAHFDLMRPIVCEKHRFEIRNFRRTVFYPDDFLESTAFDTLEIEIIGSRKKSGK